MQGYKKKKNYMHSFLKKRAIKVLIPFLVANIIYGIVKSIMGQHFTVKDILLGMLGQCTIVENSWYPIAAMIMYGAFYLAVRVFAKRKIAICTIFIIIITMIEALIFYEKSWWYISNFAFVVGMIISMYDERFDCWKIYVLSSIVGYIIISITDKYGSELGMSWLYVALPNLKSALLALLVVAIAFKLRRGANLIATYLGEISYELYLLHGLCIFVLVGSFKSTPLMLFFILVLGISILGAEIFHSINQKIIDRILRVTSNI